MDALIIETTQHGTFVECRSCGTSNYSDKKLIHRSRCKTPKAQYGVEAAVAPSTDSLKTFAANVRRTALTKGRDEDVFEAVQRGHLSMSDATNTDD